MLIQVPVCTRLNGASTHQLQFDMSHVVDISRPVSAHGCTCAFGLPRVKVEALCTVEGGASVNCYALNQYVPHSCGTHTEGIGHINKESTSITTLFDAIPPLMLCRLVSIQPVILGGAVSEPIEDHQKPDDLVISGHQLRDVLGSEPLIYDAVVIRTLPNEIGKLERDYSGLNSPYLTEQAAKFLINELGVKHVLVDLPSVDREQDNGKLLAHRAILASSPQTNTVTELCFIPDNAVDGTYLLNLQLQRIECDACPSRPLLIPIST